MPPVLNAPPHSAIEPVTDVLHGIPVTDPYRWLEDQDSPRTHAWIDEQTRYARAYLDSISGRERIRKRIREFLAVGTYDSLQKVGNRYFFRKCLPDQEQPCIYMREGPDGDDQLLINPADRGTGPFTAVKPLRVSRDGSFLLYEVKKGGERTGRFEIFDIAARNALPDVLPRGYLRGFAFAPDSKGFYYVHEAADARRPFYRAANYHVIGTALSEDKEIFFAGEDRRLRLSLLSDNERLGFLLVRFLENTRTDFYVQPLRDQETPACILRDANYCFVPWLLHGSRILAITDYQAPNLRIVEVVGEGETYSFKDLVRETDSRIREWVIAKDRIYVSYLVQMQTRIEIFDLKEDGADVAEKAGHIPCEAAETIRLLGASTEGDEIFLEAESFTESVRIVQYSPEQKQRRLWSQTSVHWDHSLVSHTEVRYRSIDGTSIPMSLFARKDVLYSGTHHPTVMTAYGGYGVSMTPLFSVFVAFLIERGCLFALPNIRGGSEFGAQWHEAAKRHKRQLAFDDFLSAAEWLVNSGRTTSNKLAIFGGSNSGLLVGAALTQRPDLFRAVVCMVPLLDMLRYHLFDDAERGKQELGTSDDSEDFRALLRYSPYHRVRDGVPYPATMIVSGGSDQKCNPLHARKMIARLQAANVSEAPVFLDYSKFRGHSPVLPLHVRVEALTDRMAFLCDQLQVRW